MSAAVWRKMSANVEAMEWTSGIPADGDNLLCYSRPPALTRRQEFPVEGYPVVPFFLSPAAVGCVPS